MKSPIALLTGEKPIDDAIPVTLRNGEQCIPQHYLVFSHTRCSVEEIVVNIEFDDKYLIFVCEDEIGVYIQIGIVGFDNYLSFEEQTGKKAVYGRKWRVEPQLPSSEIIQTVFLAIKTAREHEIRELFQLVENKRVTTPFNNHHDLPLMAQNSELFKSKSDTNFINWSCDGIQIYLDKLVYDDSKFKCKSLMRLTGNNCLVEVKLAKGKNTQLPENKDKILFLTIFEPTINKLYFHLMDELIRISNRYVEENFTYLKFARFSHENNIQSIAELASTLRKKELQVVKSDFLQRLEKTNYQTDRTRVPMLNSGPQSSKLKKQLVGLGELGGILPNY